MTMTQTTRKIASYIPVAMGIIFALAMAGYALYIGYGAAVQSWNVALQSKPTASIDAGFNLYQQHPAANTVGVHGR